jgi:hypothetical protein
MLGGHGPWPSAPAIRGLLERLSAVDVAMQAHRRLEPLATALGHARLLATVLPAQAARLDEICGRLGPPAGSAGGATVHGDLHDGQIVVDGDRVTGLLDVDSVGPGYPIDDVANLVGHLTSLPVSAAAAARPIHAYARHLRDAWASDVDPIELDRRVAAVLLGLATGPFRVQERGWRRAVVQRLHLVEGWLPSRERTLSGAS